jgi:hypothetical protein
MKQVIWILLVIGLIFGCNKQEEPAQEKVSPKSATESKADLSHYAPLFQHYFQLKDALVKGNFQQAKDAVNAFNQSLTEAAQESELSQKLLTEGKNLADASDLAAMRNGFNAFSLVMAEYAQTTPAGGVVYVQFCPMAMNSSGGYWLSSSETIENPYMGEEMLRCGEVKETIASNN